MNPLLPTGYDVVWSVLVLGVWLVVVAVLAGAAGLAGWALTPAGTGEPVGRARLRRRERAAVAAATAAGLLLPFPLVVLLSTVTASVAVAALSSCVVLVAVLAASTEGAALRTAELSAEEPPLPRARLLAAAPVVAVATLAPVGLGTWLFPPTPSIVTLAEAGMTDPTQVYSVVPPLPRPQDVVAAVVVVALLVAGGAVAGRWSRNRPLALATTAPHPSVVASLRQRVRFRLLRAVAAGSLLVAGVELGLGYGSVRLGAGLDSNDGWEAGTGALGLALLVVGCVLLLLRPPPLALAPDDGARGDGAPGGVDRDS